MLSLKKPKDGFFTYHTWANHYLADNWEDEITLREQIQNEETIQGETALWSGRQSAWGDMLSHHRPAFTSRIGRGSLTFDEHYNDIIRELDKLRGSIRR